jgi:hypothetical protein
MSMPGRLRRADALGWAFSPVARTAYPSGGQQAAQGGDPDRL